MGDNFIYEDIVILQSLLNNKFRIQVIEDSFNILSFNKLLHFEDLGYHLVNISYHGIDYLLNIL